MRKTAKIITLFLMLCGAGPAPADEDHLQARALVEAGVILPLERILDQVAAEHPGRVLEVEFEREQGRYVYEIELVDDRGRVWELEYDAENAKLLEKERED